MSERRRYAVINQKGGSTKTTTSVNLAGALVARGRKVRLIDMDPQEGSTTHWIPPTMDVGAGLYGVFDDQQTIDEATSTTSVDGLYLVPSYPSLRQIEMTRPAGSELVVKAALDASTAPVDYDMLDCPHSMDVLSIAGIAAATDLIIPVQASALDVVGMGELLNLATRVKRRMNPSLRIAAIVVGRTKGRSGFDASLLASFQQEYPEAVVLPISDTVRMREATNAHVPINVFDPTSIAARDFRALADALDPIAAVVS
jgi:chromosome partitioning protein